MVDTKYRITNTKTIIGQSLGGLLTTEILFKQPELFDNYVIVSPSLWWDNGSLLDEMPAEVGAQKKIFIAVGKEGAIMEGDAKKLYAQIVQNKADDAEVHFKFLEQQDHGDALHLALYYAFEKLFGADQ